MLDDRMYVVEQVIARWKTPDGPSFRVLSDLGPAVLSYHEESDTWYMATPGESEDSIEAN